MIEGQDPGIGPRLALPLGHDCRLGPQRIAYEHRTREPDFLPPQIPGRGSESRIVDGQANEQPEREDAVDDRLSEGNALAVFGVEMQRSGVHGQRAEQDVVRLGDGAAHRVLETLADLEFLKVESRHPKAPPAQAKSCTGFRHCNALITSGAEYPT